MASTTKIKGQAPDPTKPHESRGKSQTSPPGGTPTSALPTRPSATRETIESIVVAFMLAFLFKTFEAEAFVIPTGSMAPTLLGRNKSAHCPQCGTDFTIGASDEVESETDYVYPDMRIFGALCPNCRYALKKDEIYNVPVFKGDRILVTKFPFEIADPKRWDVSVFKYPEEPKTNYIKRCIGLPNETIELHQGNVYSITEGGGAEILRKDDPNKQRMLQLLVYDNDRPEKVLLAAGWPERWAPVKKGPGSDSVAGWSPDTEGWDADAKARSFHLPADRATGTTFRWLRYRNFVPDRNAWNAALNGAKPAEPKPKLITDFCGYNAFSNSRIPLEEDLGVYWVGDLTINCRIDVAQANADSQVVLELNEGARAYRCRLEPATGKATIAIAEPHEGDEPGDERTLSTAQTPFVGSGSHDVSFANVDDRLCLWVDGKPIDFGAAASYPPYGGLLVQRPWSEDLIPVGIAARGAEVTVSRLLLQRDIYYRGDFIAAATDQTAIDAAFVQHRPIEEFEGDKTALSESLVSPSEWFRLYEQGLASRQTGPGQRYEHVSFQFKMGDDEFFMMGDNSPRSKDSRLWSNSRRAKHRYAVPRSALVGKGFFVYWPHGIPFSFWPFGGENGYPNGPDSIWNNGLTARFFYNYKLNERQQPVLDTDYPKLRIPFCPDFGRMHRIR